MKHVLTLGEIDPEWGVFYTLLTSDRDPDMIFNDLEVEGKKSHATEEDEKIGLVLEILSSVPVYYGFCCGQNEAGKARCHFYRFTGTELGSIAWTTMYSEFVCVSELALKLVASELDGIRISQATVLSPETIDRQWYHVTNDRHKALLQPVCSPAPYHCWNCGFEPICRVCGGVPHTCPRCEERYLINEDEWRGEGDNRLVCDGTFEAHPYPIVDLRLWDGADFFGDTITHRMYQFLVSEGAHPFRIAPVAANIRGATADDLRRLDRARGQ
jgi:hypothetical protein